MCLYLYEGNAKAKIAKNDIKCYKVLEMQLYNVGWDGYMNGHRFSTPFQYFPVELNKVMTADDRFKVERYKGGYSCLIRDYEDKENKTKRIVGDVEGGGFHSFKNLNEAVTAIIDGGWDTFAVVVSAYIPKGSKYYEGGFDRFESFCSKSIVMTDEILFYRNGEWETLKEPNDIRHRKYEDTFTIHYVQQNKYHPYDADENAEYVEYRKKNNAISDYTYRLNCFI